MLQKYSSARRQKDKRIASGGPVSAGAAYRNPSSDGALPTMLSSPASSSTTATTTPLQTSLISPSVSEGRSTPSAATPIKVMNPTLYIYSHVFIELPHWTKSEKLLFQRFVFQESGNATSRLQVAPDGKPLVKRCHKAKGEFFSHILS